MPKGIGYEPKPKRSNESKRQAFIKDLSSKLNSKPKRKTSKLRRTVKELIGGSKTYLPKKKKAVKHKAAWRTSSEMAKREGLGSELRKLRRKGKGK